MADRSKLSGFAKWQARVDSKTRYLSEKLVEVVVPVLTSAGFHGVQRASLGERETVKPNGLRFERAVDQAVDSFHFRFEKYDMPSFQLMIARESIEPPHRFVRVANLVKKPDQYNAFWGKPWGLPLVLWSNSLSDKTIAAVAKLMPQALEFLDTGKRGPNLSEASRPMVLTAEARE